MIKDYNLLLMTGTISPNEGILKQGYSKTLNYQERLNQYITTILYYLSIENINGIVFIDNSNYYINSEVINNIKIIANSLGKEVEFLKFQGNTENQLKYTYGYGEFETLEFLYNNSELFKKVESVYKVTGRYKIYNIFELIKKSVILNNLFYKYNIFNFVGINMVFFKISKLEIEEVIKGYNEVFFKSTNSKIKLGGEEILYLILGNNNLNTIKTYPYFINMGYKKYGFYQFLTNIGFFDFNSFLYKTLYRISLLIPEFIKLKFNKLLKIILKGLKRN